MANWGSLWFRNMASKDFGKNAYKLWRRIWPHSLPPENIWRCVQEAMQICWNPLHDATQVFKLMASLPPLPSPPPPPALSFSLLSCFLLFPHNFLFCFLFLTRILIFLWRNVSTKNHPSWIQRSRMRRYKGGLACGNTSCDVLPHFIYRRVVNRIIPTCKNEAVSNAAAHARVYWVFITPSCRRCESIDEEKVHGELDQCFNARFSIHRLQYPVFVFHFYIVPLHQWHWTLFLSYDAFWVDV